MGILLWNQSTVFPLPHNYLCISYSVKSTSLSPSPANPPFFPSIIYLCFQQGLPILAFFQPVLCFCGEVNSFVSGTWCTEGRTFLFLLLVPYKNSWSIFFLSWQPCSLHHDGSLCWAVSLICKKAQQFVLQLLGCIAQAVLSSPFPRAWACIRTAQPRFSEMDSGSTGCSL